MTVTLARLEQQFTLAPAQITGPGIVTLNNWTKFPDGRTYLYVWSERWAIVTDKEMPVENFRSSERWQLLAVMPGDGMIEWQVRALLPGCQIKAWVACEEPDHKDADTYYYSGHDE